MAVNEDIHLAVASLARTRTRMGKLLPRQNNADRDHGAACARCASRLVAALLYDIGIGIDALRKHQDWTGKQLSRASSGAAQWQGFSDGRVAGRHAWR
jgi:N-acetylmuramoyl-L-alanine amidase CwlA